jgi:hypothetical protein
MLYIFHHILQVFYLDVTSDFQVFQVECSAGTRYKRGVHPDIRFSYREWVIYFGSVTVVFSFFMKIIQYNGDVYNTHVQGRTQYNIDVHNTHA